MTGGLARSPWEIRLAIPWLDETWKLCHVPSSVIAKHVDGEWGRLWLVGCLDVFEGAFFCRGCNVNFNWSRSEADMGFFLVLQRLLSVCEWMSCWFGLWNAIISLVSLDLSIPTCKGQLQERREFSSFPFLLSYFFVSLLSVSFSFSFFLGGWFSCHPLSHKYC